MFCPKCGKELASGVKFCPNCGNPVTFESFCKEDPFQNPTQNQAQMPKKKRIETRSIAVSIILSIVTCGIYYLVWLGLAANDLNSASDHNDDLSGVVVVLISIITCGIFSLVWFYKAGEKLEEARKIAGLPEENNGVLYLILGFFKLGFVSLSLIQNELNTIANS